MKELNELHSDSLKGEKKIKEENILKYCLTVSPVVSLFLFPECFLVAFVINSCLEKRTRQRRKVLWVCVIYGCLTLKLMVFQRDRREQHKHLYSLFPFLVTATL